LYDIINNQRIYYEQSGSGNPLILLHGWGGSTQSFGFVHQALSQSFAAYSLDLPGFGRSDEPGETWGVKEYAALLTGFINKHGIENPILIGHSFGGKVSIYTAANTAVRKMVLVDSAGIEPSRSLSYYLRVYSYKAVRKLLELPGIRNYTRSIIDSYRSKVGSSDYRNASDVMKKVFVKVVNEHMSEELKRITCPVLLIWGDQDTATPLSDGKMMEKLLKDAGLVVLTGTGHFSYLEKPHEFLHIVKYFLKDDLEAKR
jgi:pimeloyl-ACP methyl ester carboxylesterase